MSSESTIPHPKITVIIPLYNKVNEVERALSSILSQTIQDFEFIIIDGGSTDGSLEKIYPYIDNNNIKLIHQKSKGLPAARNEAIKQSSGDLIAFLDADDEWYPDYLETIVQLYIKYPGAGIYCSVEDYYLGNKILHVKVPGYPKRFEGYLSSWFEIYSKMETSPFGPCCVTLPRYIFNTVGYFNENARISEDLEMWARIAMHYPIVLTTKACACYSLEATNKMTMDFKPFTSSPVTEYLTSLPKENIDNRFDAPYIYKTIDFQNLVTAYYNLGGGNKKRAKELLGTVNTRSLKKTVLWFISLLPTKLGMASIRLYAKCRNIKYVFY